jgi:hypothetical protein
VRGLLAALVALVALVVARPAWAQVDLRAQSDVEVVGLGDVVHVTLQASSSASTPIDPQIGATGGFVVVGISPSTSQSMTIVNGVVSTSRVLTTTWTLRAQKVGTSVLGPPTVSVDGKRYRAPTLHVKVVPASQAPPRPSPRGRNDPFNFDPFNGLLQQFGQMPGFEPIRPAPEPEMPPADPRFALDAARAPVAFLHATVDKSDAVVGEQITYSVYLYVDPQAVTREPDKSDPHEAPANDFLRQSLLKDDDRAEIHVANVGGRPWQVELVRREALFPLRTGDLAIGEMKVQIGVPGGGARATEDLHVRVTEPPISGRPPGYVLGDVGQIELATEVLGNDVEQDGAIGVNVTVSGTGNVPATVTPPEQRGVEWLEPQVGDKLGRQGGNLWGGSRTFRYVVRLHRAGDVALGDFTLAFWNPREKKYEVARAPLGTVRVEPSAAAKAAEAPADPLPGLPAPRKALAGGAATRARHHLDDAASFWLALGAMPVSYVVVVAGAAAAKRGRERRAAKGKSPREEMKARVAAADDASARGDAGAIDAATARALEAACIAGREVNVRALATSDVARALDAAGVAAEVAREVEELLRACEAARFSASGDDPTEARGRWTRARGVIDRLAGAA